MDKGFGIIFDHDKKRFFKIELQFDLKTNEAKIGPLTDFGDSRAVSLYNAEKHIVNLVYDIDMTKPNQGEKNDN